MKRSLLLHGATIAAILLGSAALDARSLVPIVPDHGVIGVYAEQLSADYWIGNVAKPDEVLRWPAAIEHQNARLLRDDTSMHDIAALPATLDRNRVIGWIEALSTRPTKPLFDTDGNAVTPEQLDSLVADLALAAIPERQATRYGLVVRRADLRSFPVSMRVFDAVDDTDIDRFQESALFPGTPVVIAHESRDRRWWFVVSPRYAAWIEKTYVAEGTAAQVLGYATRTPFRVITGAVATTVFTPEEPAVSQLRLDMGVRVPALADWPAAKLVNGQNAYTSHVIELPVRGDGGALRFVPALLPRTADSADAYLPLTRANLLRQSFKFLGERYGWGHSYDARDCSGFVSDVYRSFGVELPRNTRDQSVSPVLDKRTFGPADDRDARLAAVRALDVGDLVYIPGHVMMAIGTFRGEPYMIHDTTGISYRLHDGTLVRARLNGVAVSPLLPLQFDDDELYIDRITSIVRLRATPTTEAQTTP